jgi:hypothetical protein
VLSIIRRFNGRRRKFRWFISNRLHRFNKINRQFWFKPRRAIFNLCSADDSTAK